MKRKAVVGSTRRWSWILQEEREAVRKGTYHLHTREYQQLLYAHVLHTQCTRHDHISYTQSSTDVHVLTSVCIPMYPPHNLGTETITTLLFPVIMMKVICDGSIQKGICYCSKYSEEFKASMESLLDRYNNTECKVTPHTCTLLSYTYQCTW